jgi:exodeoxyribonuclease VII small subunit
LAKKRPTNEEAARQPTFEEAIRDLEGVVRVLEEGDIGLDESLEQYERGVKLLRQCYEVLQKAERRIELLSGVDAEGNPITAPLKPEVSLAEEAAHNGPSAASLAGKSGKDRFGEDPTDVDPSGGHAIE